MSLPTIVHLIGWYGFLYYLVYRPIMAQRDMASDGPRVAWFVFGLFYGGLWFRLLADMHIHPVEWVVLAVGVAVSLKVKPLPGGMPESARIVAAAVVCLVGVLLIADQAATRSGRSVLGVEPNAIRSPADAWLNGGGTPREEKERIFSPDGDNIFSLEGFTGMLGDFVACSAEGDCPGLQ